MAGRKARRRALSAALAVDAIGTWSTYGQADEAEISDGLRRHDCCSRVGVGGWMRKCWRGRIAATGRAIRGQLRLIKREMVKRRKKKSGGGRQDMYAESLWNKRGTLLLHQWHVPPPYPSITLLTENSFGRGGKVCHTSHCCQFRLVKRLHRCRHDC